MIIYSSKLPVFGHFCLAKHAYKTFFNSMLANTKALRRRLFETLTRGILWESPQGWVHGVFEKPPAKRLGSILRSSPRPKRPQGRPSGSDNPGAWLNFLLHQ